MYKTTTAIIILGLLAYVLFLTQCRKDHCPPVQQQAGVISVDTQEIINHFKSSWTKPKPDTVIRTKVKQGKSPEPVFEYRDTGSIVYVSQPVDTAQILSSYFNVKVYRDSTNFKHGKVKVTDTVSQNMIIARQWEVEDTVKNIVKTVQPRQFYFGGGAYTTLGKDTNRTFIPGVHLDLGYINRKGQHLKLDLMRTTRDWQAGLSFYQVIRLRKQH